MGRGNGVRPKTAISAFPVLIFAGSLIGGLGSTRCLLDQREALRLSDLKNSDSFETRGLIGVRVADKISEP